MDPQPGDALLRLNAVLASFVGIRPGARILDAGCGVGGSSIWLARGFGAMVAGITPGVYLRAHRHQPRGWPIRPDPLRQPDQRNDPLREQRAPIVRAAAIAAWSIRSL